MCCHLTSARKIHSFFLYENRKITLRLAKKWIYLTPYLCTERIFDSRPFMCNKFFEKTLKEVGSSHIYASFGTFWVQIGQLFEAQWDLELSEEFEIDVIFLQKQRFYRFPTFFKDSLCLQKLTDLDAKGAKRSVNLWATNFIKSFFQKYFVVH